MKTDCERNIICRGVGIGSSCCAGRLVFFKRTRPMQRSEAPTTPERELSRVEKAILDTEQRLNALSEQVRRDTGESEAEIFEIQAMLVKDEDFMDAIKEKITAGSVAEDAVERAAGEYAETFAALEDAYLSARAADIRDVATQILDALSGGSGAVESVGDEPYLLVADELTPTETVTLDKTKILGFVIFGGTPNSHASILARAMGIPAVIGIGSIAPAYEGTYALLDASEGTLVLLPDEATLEAFQKRAKRVNALAVEHEKYLRSLINKPAVTRSGRRILIYANVGDTEEADSASVQAMVRKYRF